MGKLRQQQQQPTPSFQNTVGPSRPYVPPPMQHMQQQPQPQKQQIVEAPPQPSLEELVRQMTMQNMHTKFG